MEGAQAQCNMEKSPFPIFDLHCDLLSYLAHRPDPDAFTPDLGCSIPNLRRGKVRFQVMAIYNNVYAESAKMGLRQAEIFRDLATLHPDFFYLPKNTDQIQKELDLHQTAIVAAIENAAGIATEEIPIEQAFQNLEKILLATRRILYISMTHHGENRFGGGNYTKAGLKEDGKKLLDYINGKHICIDLSHTSDALADDILNYIHQKRLNIIPIASHSNFREVWDHPRNLRDETAKEIYAMGGLIGINFVRAFVDNDKADTLLDHIEYGLKLGGESKLTFGADFFYTADHPDPKRVPFYHQEHEDASKYQGILAQLTERGISKEQLEKLAYKNVFSFIDKLWV
ncbi:dipeptidase [Peijinzhouia sedimentorum]